LDRRSLIEERGVKTTVIAVIAVMPRRKGLIFAAKVEVLPMTASMTPA
jgi:hypothetical protein